MSSFFLIINATFNTNKLKLPLIITVSALNLGKTFLIAFSWCPTKDKEGYGFFFKILKEYCFKRPREPYTA